MRKKERLTPVPKPRRRPTATKGGQTGKLENLETNLDLSHIHPGLRPLAISVSELNFDPENARHHDEKNIEAVVGSLVQFGYDQPLVVQAEGMIVRKGNCRLQASLQLNHTHVPALVVDESRARAIARALADNRSAELGSWNADVLDSLLRDVCTNGDARLDAMLSDLARQEKLIPGEEPNQGQQAGDQTDQLKEKFQILITCETEEQQATLLERFTAEGIECKSLIA